MNKLENLAPEQAAWIRMCAYRCAYLVWPLFACIAALNAFNKDPLIEYFYWVPVSFVFAKFIHFFSKHSTRPNFFIQYELLLSALIQGGVIASVDLQLIPSLAILTPIISFAFLGGGLFLLISLVFCFLGFAIYFFSIGISLFLVSDFDLNLLSIITIIIFQIVFTLVALMNYSSFEVEQEEQESQSFIDKTTGLKTEQYFDSLLETNNFEFLSKDDESQQVEKTVLVSLFLIRIDNLAKVTQSHSQDYMNKQVAEFSYDLFYLINSRDLLIRWHEDQLLLISEEHQNMSTEQVAQSLVSSMHSHPIKGAELTPSIFCTNLHFTPSKTDKAEWRSKIQACQQAMENEDRPSSWHFVKS